MYVRSGTFSTQVFMSHSGDLDQYFMPQGWKFDNIFLLKITTSSKPRCLSLNKKNIDGSLSHSNHKTWDAQWDYKQVQATLNQANSTTTSTYKV